jgi:hypothetical protein
MSRGISPCFVKRKRENREEVGRRRNEKDVDEEMDEMIEVVEIVKRDE